MADQCNDPDEGLVHKSHTNTGHQTTHQEGPHVVTYAIWKCECGGHTMEVFVSAKELP